MSQSLHNAIPTPHFGCHFDGHMYAKPFAQQEEGQDAEHETDVKYVKDDFTNNNNQAASDDIKPLDARPRPLQEVINERRISQGRKPITNEEYYREINHLEHCPTCRSFCMPAPRNTGHDLLAPLFRHPEKQERDCAKNSFPLIRRLPPRPEHPPPIDPQKARENFYKNRPYMKWSA